MILLDAFFTKLAISALTKVSPGSLNKLESSKYIPVKTEHKRSNFANAPHSNNNNGAEEMNAIVANRYIGAISASCFSDG